jgi:hypothetical protein
MSFVDEILQQAVEATKMVSSMNETEDEDGNKSDDTVLVQKKNYEPKNFLIKIFLQCEDTKFWDKHMVIDSKIYSQLISWKKSFKSIAEEGPTGICT